ncbi:hypothetical protein ISF6_1653 [Piscinibacter sakaiensis]|uniref:histidine kinase n=1 Tax=Piscinibacter sakaiensis TaxID=1547922 RepID=A0A0K8NVA4_PISS1|nr:hypothetical protein ISF6_1653 [Piscinibacter sakaiensis]
MPARRAPDGGPLGRWAVRLAVRVAALGAAAAATGWALASPLRPATALLAAALALAAFGALWREARRGHAAVGALLEALVAGDGTRRLDGLPPGADLERLGTALQALLERERAARLALERRQAQWLALVEHVPLPLLAIDAEGRATLLNHAARRCFGAASPRPLDSFDAFGPGLAGALRQDPPPALVELHPADEAAQSLRVSAGTALFDGRLQRLVALQPIQAELDAAESRLSADLLRVLTHEVMNSLTPVTSLLRSAEALLPPAPGAAAAPAGMPAPPGTDPLATLRQALGTATRRAEGLAQFVERYRAVARPLQVRTAPVDAHALAASLARLFAAEWPAERARLALDLPTGPFALQADRDLLEPVLMNLLRNAAQAGTRVRLAMRRSASGRSLVEVEDDGPGIPPERRAEVFLPFFTTRAEGHGVGLALARQVVLAHGGSIRVDAGQVLGGACLRLVL